MAFFDTTWYCNAGDQATTGYYAVAKRPQNTAVAAGVLRRQFTTPTVGQERVYVCIVAGTTANTTDATWAFARGSKITDGTAQWQECTGASAVNGDLTNTPSWSAIKAIGGPMTLGVIIKRNNGVSYQICTGASSLGASEPAFSDIAGVTTVEGSTTWTSLGPVGNFTNGGAPHARLANACASNWFAAGNTIYVGDNHAESQATQINTLTPIGTSTTIGKILGHDHSGSYPPASTDLMTGATISTTAASIIWGAQGAFYIYGLTFKAGVGASTQCLIVIAPNSINGLQNWTYFDACSFWIATTAASACYVQVGNSAGSVFNTVVFNNVTVKFGAVQHYVVLTYAQLVWQNTGQVLASGSVVPNALIQGSLSLCNLNNAVLEALDLSQITSSLHSTSTSAAIGNLMIKDCKLNAAVTVTTPTATGMVVQLVRSDSSGTAYKSARYAYEGTETTETSITRVGGATDGVTSVSAKVVTTANSQWLRPFTMMPLAVWNEVTGADVTVTVYGTVNSVSLPNNDDLWMDVEYLGTSGTPLGVIKTTTKASLLAANAAVSSDGSSWNGGGSGAGWSPFKLVATLSSPQPQMKGYIYPTVKAAKLSTTYYLDPQVILS